MITEVRTILSNEVGVVLKSPDLLLMLLRVYSALYLNGEAPRACEKCQRGYYEQLRIDGIMKAELQEKIIARTCVPAWAGRMYSTKVFEFLIPALMYDEKAIELLKCGALKESDFKVLPVGYQKKINFEAPQAEKKPIEVVKRGRKPNK
jgi:hypothetical protein